MTRTSLAMAPAASLLVAAASGCPRGRGVGVDSGSAADAGAAGLPGKEVPAVETDAGVADAPGTCPADMVLVEGLFCPLVDQRCKEHHPEYLRDRQKSERCLAYEEPTRCLSKERVPMRFCMDRFEWPNEKGAVPIVLVDWHRAGKTCASVGKRLCTVAEFDFACEGEEMRPHVYGFLRDATKCNIDKEYRARTRSLAPYERCLEKPKCRAELEKLDQRAPSGSYPECVSPFGAYDLNGNVNEWVTVPDAGPPNRSGLKGGWWGPVRCRCRPTVTFHKEDDYGYEAGFRCCKDAAAAEAGTSR